MLFLVQFNNFDMTWSSVEVTRSYSSHPKLDQPDWLLRLCYSTSPFLCALANQHIMTSLQMALHFDPSSAILKSHGKYAGPLTEIEVRTEHTAWLPYIHWKSFSENNLPINHFWNNFWHEHKSLCPAFTSRLREGWTSRSGLGFVYQCQQQQKTVRAFIGQIIKQLNSE